MIYVIGIIRRGYSPNGEIIRYKILDILSESCIVLTPNQLKDILLNCNIPVVNAELLVNSIGIHPWVEKITAKLSGADNDDFINKYESHMTLTTAGCPFILLAKEGSLYKVVNYHGALTKLSFDELKTIIREKELANCTTLNTAGETQIKGVCTYKIIIDRQFEEKIALQYEAFVAKANALGYGTITFDYEIENHQVKIKKYTGSSRDIILPPFITAIMKNAFSGVALRTLDLNEGLRVIGAGAFTPEDTSDLLGEVEIPSTVELVGPGAFIHNLRLFKNDGTYNMDKLRLRNNKTVILNLYN